MAGPAVCTSGYYDATCTPMLQRGYQPPPVCSTSAGWTTVSSAHWIGSQFAPPQCNYQAPPTCSTDPGWTTAAPAGWTGAQWTSPQCSYQAPPSCPSGFHQTVGASWNGAAWVGQQCQPDAQTETPDQIALANCRERAAQDGITLTTVQGLQPAHLKYNGVYYWTHYYNHSTGPQFPTPAGGTGNLWSVSCSTNDDGSWASVPQAYFHTPEYDACQGCGGGT